VRAKAVVVLVAALAAGAGAEEGAEAAQVKVHQLQGASAFLGGKLEGVRLDDSEALTLAAHRERVASIPEPFAFALAALPDGWAVGTGNEGKVMKIGRDGKVSLLFDAPEAEVFALWADADGTLFAGTSPGGKVYRIRGDLPGGGEPFFDPGATYIWAIARGAEGALWIATGVEGKLFRVDAGGRGSVAWDSTEPHLRSLLPLAGGRLLIGTVGQGRVVERDAEGAIRTLYDSPLAEVVALSPAAVPGGTEVYAAVLASEASFVELEPKAREGGADAAPRGDGDSETAEAPAAGTRAAGASGPRSELVRLLADGIAQPLWTSQEETLFALLAAEGRIWFGTGAEGKLYSLDGDESRFEGQFEERQIVGLAAGAAGPVLLTTNAAAIYRTADRPRDSGTFTGAVADAGQPARYGVLRWTGARPRESSVKASFRFGASAAPDDSWSEWSAPVELGGDGAGESPIPAAPPARYLQYRLDLAGTAAAAPAVASLEISYRQVNQLPRIERFGALEPGQLLVPANFNPADQVYEPASPNRDGIFTSVEPAMPDNRTKTLWKRGMRTLRWRASDPNGDELRARLSFRPEPANGSGGDGGWLEIAKDRKEDYYAFDATAIPDGRYRFRLELSDAHDNEAATALVAVEISEPVIVDHSPPHRRALERRAGGVRLTVADDWNPLVRAEISIDAGEWRDLDPVDGLVDGRSEQFELGSLPRGAGPVLLRVTDAAWNVTTYDLKPELEP
jgi:outer membrane protein assembly factor BamB